jgi:hypothetical protein
VDATGSASGVPPPVAVYARNAWQAASAMPASVTSRARTIRAAAKNTPRAAPHSRRNAAAAPPTKLQIDDLDAELIADFLAHIETARRNGARPKLRANTPASNNRDGRASTRRESGRLRVLIVPTRSVRG